MSSQVLWLLPGLGVIAVALVVATAVARRCSLRRRWNAALAGSGTAAAATALAWGLSRLGDWLGRARGPLEWLGQTAGAGSDPLRLAQAAGRMSLGAAVIFGGTLIACSWWRTRSAVPAPTLPVPLNRLAAVTAALSALVIMGLLAADVVVLESMLDLAAVAPIVACGLGLHALANPNQAPEAALFAKDALAHPADRSPAAAHSATAAALAAGAIGSIGLPVLACLPAWVGTAPWQLAQVQSLPCLLVKKAWPRAACAGAPAWAV